MAATQRIQRLLGEPSVFSQHCHTSLEFIWFHLNALRAAWLSVRIFDVHEKELLDIERKIWQRYQNSDNGEPSAIFFLCDLFINRIEGDLQSKGLLPKIWTFQGYFGFRRYEEYIFLKRFRRPPGRTTRDSAGTLFRAWFAFDFHANCLVTCREQYRLKWR